MEDNRKDIRIKEEHAKSWLLRHWALIPIALYYLAAAAVFLFAGENALITVADNLDLFQSQYQMLKNTGTFFARDVSAPFLGGISRNVLPSELSLTSLLYFFLPSLAAYEAIYFLKMTLSVLSFVLLAKELDEMGLLAPKTEKQQEDHKALRFNIFALGGLAYGMLNLFPSFGICFAAIPLLVWLVLKLEREEKVSHSLFWLLGIFLYPFVCYFSYFGLFLIVYLLLAFLVKSTADTHRYNKVKKAGERKKLCPDYRLLLAAIFLFLGSAVFEYRLFAQMLFSDEVTIRQTMVQTSLSPGEICRWILDVLINGVDMHCESVHCFIVLPVCVLYLVIRVPSCIKRGKLRDALCDITSLAFFLILFNSLIYGLYYSEIVRLIVETILPPLTGFQFNRTAYFNPFLWYGLFSVALYRFFLWLEKKRSRPEVEPRRILPFLSCMPWVLSFAALLVILVSDTTYNDVKNTAEADIRELLGREQTDMLTYGEFYSEELFEEIKADIGYEEEWAVAYGLHPAVLNYNGISTLDGYLGFYSQEYKEAFRAVIEPALRENEATRIYYDEWGARCYLYSGHNTTIVEAVRNYTHEEDTIDINEQALKDMGCKYIFSRIHITNADEKDLLLVGTYENENSPYKIYVYELIA